jgi:hypothetical protein
MSVRDAFTRVQQARGKLAAAKLRARAAEEALRNRNEKSWGRATRAVADAAVVALSQSPAGLALHDVAAGALSCCAEDERLWRQAVLIDLVLRPGEHPRTRRLDWTFNVRTFVQENEAIVQFSMESPAGEASPDAYPGDRPEDEAGLTKSSTGSNLPLPSNTMPGVPPSGGLRRLPMRR